MWMYSVRHAWDRRIERVSRIEMTTFSTINHWLLIQCVRWRGVGVGVGVGRPGVVNAPHPDKFLSVNAILVKITFILFYMQLSTGQMIYARWMVTAKPARDVSQSVQLLFYIRMGKNLIYINARQDNKRHLSLAYLYFICFYWTCQIEFRGCALRMARGDIILFYYLSILIVFKGKQTFYSPFLHIYGYFCCIQKL